LIRFAGQDGPGGIREEKIPTLIMDEGA